MPEHALDRRTFVGLVGATTLVGLAGCTGTASDATTQTSTPATSTAATAHAENQHEDDSHGTNDAHHATEEHHDEATAADHHEEAEHHDSGETHTVGGHSGQGPVAHAEVKMQTIDSGQHFHPHVAWVEPGGTVTFHNESGAHTATAYHPANGKSQRIPEDADPFDSGLLTEEGATWEHTFETEGVYDIYCVPHEQMGMIGTVVVGKPDPHGQPGLAEPQRALPDTAATKIRNLNEQVNTMLGHEH